MKFNESVVNKQFEKRLHLELSPEVSRGGVDDTDWRLADLLAWLKQFHRDIQEIRLNLNIKTVPYPNNPTLDELIEIVYKATGDQFQSIINEGEKLRKKYHLTENWYMSMISAIVTHTILIPPKISISIHVPELLSQINPTQLDKPKSIVGIASSVFDDPSIKKTQRALQLYKYPALYFTRQMSIDEIKKWINKNKNILRLIMRDLPKQRIIKRKQTTIFWGQTVWMLRQDGVTSYTKMTKIIQGWIDKDLERGHPIYDDITAAPNPEELEKHYERFLESLSSLEPVA